MNKKSFILVLCFTLFFGVMSARAQVKSGSDSTECARLNNKVHLLSQAQSFQPLYDTARHCIEMCAVQSGIWRNFGSATFGVQYMSDDVHRWSPYREWLKKVLYLNLDTNYYCADVDAISSSFQYFSDSRGFDMNGALAVTKFLLDSHRCLSWLKNVGQEWTNSRREQYKTWKDTVVDSLKTPLDTTLPSLEDLNLQILRGPQYAAVKDAFTPSSVTKIKYLLASENPFTVETKLRFNLADAEYMKIEIFDILGNKIYSDSKLFGEGLEEWRLDAKALERGILYARLSTMGGEVRTVKLIHE